MVITTGSDCQWCQQVVGVSVSGIWYMYVVYVGLLSVVTDGGRQRWSLQVNFTVRD